MTGWRVWGELGRRTHIDLVFAYISGAKGLIEREEDGRTTITLDARLRQDERRATLAHELIHDERGILFDDDTPIALIVKEEQWVEAEAVRRLVPTDELDEIVQRRELDGETVGCDDVMEWYEVPRDVAELALKQVERVVRRRHPSGR
jgi:hypothetical protein